MEQAIEIRDLNKRYRDGTWANRDITLNVSRGEFLGILGPNGAGKTTLVRQITTELLPTTGEIQVFNRNALSEPMVVKALLGIIPQDASLYWNLSVWQHLRIFGKLRGLTRVEAHRRANELIEILGLKEHRNKTPQALSGGLRRRVLVGIATLTDPPLMVFDEPTVGLDPKSRRDLWSYIKSQQRGGATILLTTHYMEEAEALCDRVGIIHRGRLIALDTIPNLRAAHGLQFKVTFQRLDGSGELETIYGEDHGELAERVGARGIREYSISKANLEDVFLALTGEREAFE